MMLVFLEAFGIKLQPNGYAAEKPGVVPGQTGMATSGARTDVTTVHDDPGGFVAKDIGSHVECPAAVYTHECDRFGQQVNSPFQSQVQIGGTNEKA